MSIKIMNWVWEYSTAKGSELLLLLAIADAADDQGRNAFPSISTLSGKTRMSRRTVQRLVVKLESDGHLRLSRAGGRRANTYEVVWGEGTGGLAKSLPVPSEPTPHEVIHTGANLAPRQDDTGDNLSPQGRQSGAGSGVNLTPQGCHSHVTAGVSQLCHPIHPLPVLDPPPPAPPTPTNGGGGESTTESDDEADRVLEQLGAEWRLGTRSAERLRPALRSALASGWTAEGLAAQLGKDAAGVRSPYAVLTARLSDLPAAPPRSQRLAWCGECHEPTRMRETDAGQPYRCPACHPALDREGIPTSVTALA